MAIKSTAKKLSKPSLSDSELVKKYDTGEEIDFPKVIMHMIPYPYDKKDKK